MEHAVEDRPDGLRLGCRRVRVLHLAENLRLADDQRIEAGRDAEQVARRLQIAEFVHMWRDVAR
jgi:hypothetical protein